VNTIKLGDSKNDQIVTLKVKEFLLKKLFTKKIIYLNSQTTKTKKASPTPMPANRIRVLSTKILLENSGKT